MKRIVLTISVVLAALVGWSAPVVADVTVAAQFSRDEVRVISTWFREHGTESKGRGRGKKQGGLPPGIARNLARGKPLPPGIAKQYLPDGLAHMLPAPPRGFERIIVDGKILLVEIATHVVHDILTDIVFR